MSTSRVVDTDAFSFTHKGDTRAALYVPHLTGHRLHLAFATVAELYRWATLRGWGQVRIDDLCAAIAQYTVVGFDDETAWEWAGVMALKGRPIGPSDAWVAAIAIRHGMPLVTHNRKDFEGIPGLNVISEA